MFSKKYITVVLLLVLFIPFCDKGLNLSEKYFKYESNEKRALAKLPEIDITYLDAFPKPYEEYFNDHFMCRNYFIDQYNGMRVRLFKQSPVPEKAFIGNDGWLYLNNYDYNRDHKVNFSNKQLENFLKELKQRQDFLKQQNCSLYVYIVPPKIKVYPEYIGTNKPFYEPDQGKALEKYIKTNSDIHVTYLLSALEKGKSEDGPSLFSKTDNHWSDYGCYTAYKKIMQDLREDFPKLKLLKPAELISSDDVVNGGNIASMMGVQNYFKEKRHSVKVKKARSKEVNKKGYITPGFEMDFEHQFENENKDLPTAMFIRDSFGGGMIPFLSEGFSHTIYIFDAWKYQLNEEIVKNEKPQILVYLIYEPLLLNMLDNSKSN